MKILQVINSLHTGGAEKLLLDTIPKYNEKGIVMDLLLLNGEKTPFYKKLEALNICTIFSLSNGTVYNPFLIFKLIPYLKKYDIIHVHLFPAQYWVVIAKLLSFSKVKLVFTEHNTTNKRVEIPFISYLNKFIYIYYSATICITEEIRKEYISYTGLSKKRFITIKNGIDLTEIKNAQSISKQIIHPEIYNNDVLLMQVASFREQKDQNTLIRAMKHLPDNIKLLLVGDGDLINKSMELVNIEKLTKRVFFLGNRYDVPQLLKSVDIVVLSSKHEGLSLSCIEGMASGNPFVASDVPGLTEIVKGAGILFPKGDFITLANKISLLLNDKIYRNQIVSKCVKRALDFDNEIMVEKHIKLYEKI